MTATSSAFRPVLFARWTAHPLPRLGLLAAVMAIAVTLSGNPTQADIYRWDTGDVIPGTEGIEPGPGVQLDHRELEYAELHERNLTGATFEGSNLWRSILSNANLSGANLRGAILSFSTMTDADLSGSNLHYTNMEFSILTNANLTGAVVQGADFEGTTSRGFTRDQLYSTASYQAKDLQGIGLWDNDLSGWDFSGQNLTHATLGTWGYTTTSLANAKLIGANLTYAQLYHLNLMNADLTGAVINGTNLGDTTSRGFTEAQLYSTASYRAKDLQGVSLFDNDVSGWDFSGQNLSNAHLAHSNLMDANFVGANLTDAYLYGAQLSNANLTAAVVSGASFSTASGFTRDQLYATASYESKNLQGIQLAEGNDLTGWDFRGQDLTNAGFGGSTMSNVDLTDAVVRGAELSGTTLTQAQLYSTASYQDRELQGVGLAGDDLSGWDFSGQNLTDANFNYSNIKNANLRGAAVRGASFCHVTGFAQDQLYSTSSYESRDLRGVNLLDNDLSGWNFAGQNLQHATFRMYCDVCPDPVIASNLTGANLSFADTRGAQLSAVDTAETRNMIWPDGAIQGLDLRTAERLVIRNYNVDPNEALPPIPIIVNEEMTIANGGALELRFDEATWDSLIMFAPSIPVQFDGTLELTFADGVSPTEQAARTFRIFDWTGVTPTGAFTIDSDYLWDLTNLYTSGEVTLIATLAGDTNGDGQVNLDDLNNVRNHFGETGAPGLPGDAIPFDGIVDLVDLNTVRNNFGATQPTSTSVPEPSGRALGATIVFCISLIQTARRAR